jgi:hypothetical protein
VWVSRERNHRIFPEKKRVDVVQQRRRESTEFNREEEDRTSVSERVRKGREREERRKPIKEGELCA